MTRGDWEEYREVAGPNTVRHMRAVDEDRSYYLGWHYTQNDVRLAVWLRGTLEQTYYGLEAIKRFEAVAGTDHANEHFHFKQLLW